MEYLLVLDYLQSQYFWTTLSFVVLLAVVAKYVVPAVTAVLDARAESIHNDLQAAMNQRAEAEKVLAEYQAQLANARKEAADVVLVARAEAEVLAAKRLADVEAEIARKGEEARKSIEAARVQALRDVQGEVTAVALQVAEKLLGEGVDTRVASNLTDNALKQKLDA